MKQSSDRNVAVVRYRVRKGAGKSAIAPSDSIIEVHDGREAFLLLDGVRTIRADSLSGLLAQLHLEPREIEVDAT
jgi:hypothetical protein